MNAAFDTSINDIPDIPDDLFRFKKNREQDGQNGQNEHGMTDAETVEPIGKKEAIRSLNFAQDSWRRLKKNPAAISSLAVLLAVILAACFAPLLAPYPPNEQHVPFANLPPRISGCRINGFNGMLHFRGAWIDRYADAGVPDNVHFLLGTDEFGRDLFSRLLFGTRISLVIAFLAALLDLSLGVSFGLTSAMCGGKTDTVMQRLLEILAGVPSLVIVVLMLLIFTPGMTSIIFALAISSWIPMARLVRAQSLRIKQLEYVLAARALGASTFKIALSHVLPNISGTVIVRTMFSIPTAIFFETFLSFIGVGMKIPNASIGTLLGSGYKVFRIYAYQMWVPAILLCAIMLSFNLFADALRDAFDPKMKD